MRLLSELREWKNGGGTVRISVSLVEKESVGDIHK